MRIKEILRENLRENESSKIITEKDICEVEETLSEIFGDSIIENEHLNTNYLNINSNYIAYHLWQLKGSISSFLILSEICKILIFIRNWNSLLIENKIYNKYNEVNLPQLKNTLFEFYVLYVLKTKLKEGNLKYFDTTTEKPADAIIEYDNKEIVIECTSIEGGAIENDLADLASQFFYKYNHTVKENFVVANPISTIIIFKVFNENANQYIKGFKEIKKYLHKIVNEPLLFINEQEKSIDPFPLKKDHFEFAMYRFDKDLYDQYFNFYKPKNNIIIRLYAAYNLEKKDKTVTTEFNADFKTKDITEKIISVIRKKTIQHRGKSKYDFLGIIIEYENHNGIKRNIDLNWIKDDEVKKYLRENEFVILIHKSSIYSDKLIRNQKSILGNRCSELNPILDKIDLRSI
jgi:hypothetical protein